MEESTETVGVVEPPKRKRGRPSWTTRTAVADVPDTPIGKDELIRLICKRLRIARSTHEFQWAVEKLIQLRGWALEKPKKRVPVPRGMGPVFKKVWQQEASDKREALAANKENDHGTEQ
jgi:hypothetical protein